MESADLLGTGEAALAAGRWEEARTAFEQALAAEESADAHLGLGFALWWLGATRVIRQEANERFAHFVTDEGRLELPFESLVVVGRRETADGKSPYRGEGGVGGG